MKLKTALAAAIFGSLMMGCNKSDAPATEAPPPSAAPATPASATGYEAIAVADGGTVSGSITVSGAIPKLPRRSLNKDPQVCGTGSRESQQLIVSKGGGLKNAIVVIQGVKRGKPMDSAAAPGRIDQSKCEYVPHVQVVPVNTELEVLNSDPILHNIHLYQNDESVFNIAQPLQGQSNKKKLENTGFYYAECDVHGWMQGHVAVVDNPYYAVTDENGKFSIADLPPGEYDVRIWHEYLGEKSQHITVGPKAEVRMDLDLKDLLDQKTPAPAITSNSTAPAAPSAAADKTAPAAGGAAAAPAEVVVQMQSEGTSYHYEPANITIKVGTTVKWMNVSTNRHTATDDPELEKLAGQAILPQGVMPWDSPFLSEGQSFTKTFTTPGKYQYFCRNHGQFGMVATITVVP